MGRLTHACTALSALALALAFPARAQQGLENVIVEKYYISDASDATDTDGGFLVEGSTVYRVFLDMGAGYKLRGLFGDSLHTFFISSTEVIFNNTDRGEKYGHDIPNIRLDENTVALDSWLSLGDASDAHIGVVKTDDTDGSIVGGVNNDGGSQGVAGGLLINDDADAGIPLTTSDGLLPSSGQPPPGFLFLGDILDALDNANSDTTYTSQNMVMQCPAGVAGYGPDNKILIVQITTVGELSFALNVELLDTSGTVHRYVANDDTLAANETAFGLLNYPPECGCMDPNFLEYDPTAGCDDGSCATPIVFGCLDTLACNFDPDANFNVNALCCYGPGNCNGLDISIVCPDVSVEEGTGPVIEVFPNPAHDNLTVRCGQGTSLTLFDELGRVKLATTSSGRTELDLSDLANGTYVLRAVLEGSVTVQRIVKQ